MVHEVSTHTSSTNNSLHLEHGGGNQAQEPFRESEECYRTVLDSIDEGFCVIEVLLDDAQSPIDYQFVHTNPAFEKHTGLANAVGQRMKTLAPNHEPHWFESYGNVALTGQPIRFENQAKALNRWYDVYAFRFGPAQQRQVAVLFNDITERKHRMQEYQRVTDELEKSKASLEEKVYDLEVFHDIAVDRELKMMQMEKEIAMLREQLAKLSKTGPD